MKSIMLIIDGWGDTPCPELENQTPLQMAGCRHITALAGRGTWGTLHTCPAGFSPESTICTMSLLGVDPGLYPKGRASLEALAIGVDLGEQDVALRCNLVRVDERGRLISFNGGDLTEEEIPEAVRTVDFPEQGMEFYPVRGYRNILVMRGIRGLAAGLVTFPPHDHVGEMYAGLLPQNTGLAHLLRDFMAMNEERLEALCGPGYRLWPWGASQRPEWPLFADLHGVSGAAVCCIETVKGMAKALGLFAPDIKTATGDVDTDLRAKTEAALELIDEFDFVLIHVNGADEAAHRLNGREKSRFLQRVDAELIGPLARGLGAKFASGCRMLLCGDHATFSTHGRHQADPVPFILAEPDKTIFNGPSPGRETFYEETARQGLRLTGQEGLKLLLKE